MNPTGRARTETEVVDLSVLSNTGLNGISAVLGVTERGPIGKSVLVGSWVEYVRIFGGYLSGSLFPLLCKRTLDRGGKLRVARVAHYTDIDDSATISGAVATVVVAGAGSPAPDLKLNADNIGAWGNGLKVEFKATYNGIADTFDAKVTLDGSPDLEKTVFGLPKILTLDAIRRFNTESTLVKIDENSVGFSLSAAKHTLASGAQDISLIVPIDYIGDPTTQTGLYIFDNDNDFVRVAVPEKAIPEIDTALVAYADSRKDCRAILRTPTGVTGLVAVDYREGTGVYEHSPVNSWFASMVYGTLKVTDPKSGGAVMIPAIADVLGAMSQKDSNNDAWIATAGSKRGRLANIIGVDYNLGVASRATEFDQVVNHGINAVINDTTYGPVYWGNRTLYKSQTLLRNENVADLLIYITRVLAPLIKSELFDPNDVETWRAIYRNVRPALEYVKSRRGIWDYLYEGDQLVDSIEEATINDPSNVDAGQYVFYLWLKPKSALEYVGVKVVVTNSGISFDEVAGQPNSVI